MTIKRHGVGPRLSQAVVHGDTVYLAGMVAADPSADAKGQTQQILKKIDETLAAVGSHKSKILAATVYVANMGIYGDMNAAWDAWVDPANTPARATVEARLASPKYLVEIMATASISEGDPHERSRHRRQLADSARQVVPRRVQPDASRRFHRPHHQGRPRQGAAARPQRGRGRDHGLRPAARLAGPQHRARGGDARRAADVGRRAHAEPLLLVGAPGD